MMGKTENRLEFVDLLKVILTVGIVFRHAELVGMEGRSAAFDVFSRGMMGLTSVCVPLFFVLSGFLYFYKVPARPDARYFLNKSRKRVFSLVFPAAASLISKSWPGVSSGDGSACASVSGTSD